MQVPFGYSPMYSPYNGGGQGGHHPYSPYGMNGQQPGTPTGSAAYHSPGVAGMMGFGPQQQHYFPMSGQGAPNGMSGPGAPNSPTTPGSMGPPSGPHHSHHHHPHTADAAAAAAAAAAAQAVMPSPSYTSAPQYSTQLPLAGRHRVTTTLWEDEGTLCFQVDARGVCVARRHGKSEPLGLSFLQAWSSSSRFASQFLDMGKGGMPRSCGLKKKKKKTRRGCVAHNDVLDASHMCDKSDSCANNVVCVRQITT